jgi:hypothetical protein
VREECWNIIKHGFPEQVEFEVGHKRVD